MQELLESCVDAKEEEEAILPMVKQFEEEQRAKEYKAWEDWTMERAMNAPPTTQATAMPDYGHCHEFWGLFLHRCPCSYALNP